MLVAALKIKLKVFSSHTAEVACVFGDAGLVQEKLFLNYYVIRATGCVQKNSKYLFSRFFHNQSYKKRVYVCTVWSSAC